MRNTGICAFGVYAREDQKILTTLVIWTCICPHCPMAELEGPHPTPTAGGCSLQDVIWYLFQGVCGPDLSDVGPLSERA